MKYVILQMFALEIRKNSFSIIGSSIILIIIGSVEREMDWIWNITEPYEGEKIWILLRHKL